MVQLLTLLCRAKQRSDAASPDAAALPRREQHSWRYLDIIGGMIDKPGGRSHRSDPAGGCLPPSCRRKRTVRLDRDARPLLLIEDPGNPSPSNHAFRRTAPANLLPLACYHRSETAVPDTGRAGLPAGAWSTRVSAWRFRPGGMNAEESRRIAFHIR